MGNFRLSIPNLRILRAFEAVGRLKSVSGAARAIFVSQPAVTHAIAKLENNLGEHLFHRRTKGSYLTAAGTVFHRDTAQLLQSLECALSALLRDLSAEEITAILNKITSCELEALIAIAEYTNSRAAAKHYRTHESSIIRSARQLETAIGIPLLIRTAAGVQVNEQGTSFAMDAARALHEFDGVMQSKFARQSNKTVSIGAPVLDNSRLLAAVVNEFATLAPDTTVRMFNESFDSLRLRLRSGALNMIVGVLKPHSTDLQSEVLVEENYFIAGRIGHPLAAKPAVCITDLSRFDWVVPDSHSPRRQVFEKIFANSGKHPVANLETHSLTTTVMTVASSNRLALLTESELYAQGVGRLAAIPYFLEAHTQIGLTYLKTVAHSPYHATLVALFHKHAQALKDSAIVYSKSA